MIRIMVAQLLDDKRFSEGRRISLSEVCEATGISKTSLNRIMNEKNYNFGIHSVDALCKYFKCQPGDLLRYVSDDA